MRKILTLAGTLLMVFSMTTSCFAIESSSNSVPINANISATSYNVLVPESIEITGAPSSSDATVSDFKVENKSPVGCVKVSLNLKNKDWEAKAFSTLWGNEPVNEHCFGLKADNTKDMYETIDSTAYVASESVAPNGSDTTKFKGKLPAQSIAVTNAHVGDIITTIEWV